MIDTESKLAHPPIVEAVLDFECDLPPGQYVASLEGRARDCFSDHYPTFQTQFVQVHQIAAKPGESPEVSVQHNVQALQFLQDDGKQLVQVRMEGFSFNRLAPYESLDDYLPEIERAWRLYVGLAKPIRIREIRMRYINRIFLPMVDGQIELEEYLNVAPRLPLENTTFVGFLNQHAAIEAETGNRLNIVLTTQAPEGHKLPLIFDNSVVSTDPGQPEDWPWILAKILVLRDLKNRIFKRTLTEKCLNLFRQP